MIYLFIYLSIYPSIYLCINQQQGAVGFVAWVYQSSVPNQLFDSGKQEYLPAKHIFLWPKFLHVGYDFDIASLKKYCW